MRETPSSSTERRRDRSRGDDRPIALKPWRASVAWLAGERM
jgi:hypothetical protein